jgi:hypothetical protein
MLTAHMITADTITDDEIRAAYRDGIINYDLLEFATFPAWIATQHYYRARVAEILNNCRAETV